MDEDNTMIVYEVTDVNEGGNLTWSHEATQLLLKFYINFKSLLKNYKTKVFYELISMNLKKLGVDKSREECNKKYHNMLRTYRNCLKKDNRHEKFIYFEDFEMIMAPDDHQIDVSQSEDVHLELIEIEKKFGYSVSSNRDQFEDDDFNKSGTLQSWNKESTECLIALYKHYKHLFATHKTITVFEFLSSKLMETIGSKNKNALEIQQKFNNLMRTYKICSKNSTKVHQRFQFFDAMDEIFNMTVSDFDEQEIKMMEQEFQDFELKQNDGKSNAGKTSLDWSDEELLILVTCYLEQSSEEQINWDRIFVRMQQNDFFRSAQEIFIKFKQLLIDYKSMLQIGINDVSEAGPLISELSKAFKREEDLDQTIQSLDVEHDSIRTLWTSGETIKLIELYAKHINLFKKPKKITGWSRLAKEMQIAGFPIRPYKTLKQKFDNLKRTYKTVFENEAIYMVKPKKFKFYNLLKPIFGKYELYWLKGIEPVTDEEESSNENELEEEPIHGVFENKKRPPWNDIETRALIKEYGNVFHLSATNNLWRDVTKALNNQNVHRFSEEISKKWSNLQRTYRATLPKYLKTGITPSKFPYFHDLREIFEESVRREAEWCQDEQDNATEDLYAETTEEYILEEKSAVELDVKVSASKNLWSTFETTSLINLIKTQQSSKMNWSLVSRALRRRTVLRSPIECRKKWNNIVRSYTICKAKQEINSEAVINFKHFDLMRKSFGEQLPVFNRNRSFLTKETMIKVIDLKHQLTQQQNFACLSISQWRQLGQTLKLNVTPELLKLNYYNLLKKYKFLCKRKNRKASQWYYYKEFDKYYGEPIVKIKTGTECVVQEEYQEDDAPKTCVENSDEKMQYLADNFMDICKICLEPSSDLNYIESSEKELIDKINFLFFDESSEKLDPNVSNLICITCVEQVENFYLFKQRFKQTASVLKDFSMTYTITSNEPEWASNEPELTNNIKTEDVEFEEYQQFEQFEYEEYIDETYIEENKTVEELEYSDLIDESPSQEEIVIDIPKPGLQPKTPKTFKCSRCDRVFKRLESCKSHMRSHLNMRNYECKTCGKTYISHQSLNKHQAVHNKGVIRYKCTECNAGFYRQAVYRRHLTIHGIGLNHYCQVCSQGFLWASELKEHMNIHSANNSKPYTCDICFSNFGKKRYLRSHIRQYHEKPGACDICFENFSTSFKLKEHKRTQHGIVELAVL